MPDPDPNPDPNPNTPTQLVDLHMYLNSSTSAIFAPERRLTQNKQLQNLRTTEYERAHRVLHRYDRALTILPVGSPRHVRCVAGIARMGRIMDDARQSLGLLMEEEWELLAEIAELERKEKREEEKLKQMEEKVKQEEVKDEDEVKVKHEEETDYDAY